MADSTANITLDSIVRSYKHKLGHNTLHGYVRYMSFLIDFLRSFSMSMSILDTNRVLKVDEKKAIQWPPDCIWPSALSFISGDRLIKFTLDPRINLNQDYCDDAISPTPDLPYQVYQLWPYNRTVGLVESTNLCVQELGRGDNGLGYFRHNFKNRETQFNANIPSPGKVVLTYKSTGVDPKADSTRPIFMSQVAENYIHWQDARFKYGDGSAETQARKVAYLASYDEVQAQLDPIDYEAIVGARARSVDINKFIH